MRTIRMRHCGLIALGLAAVGGLLLLKTYADDSADAHPAQGYGARRESGMEVRAEAVDPMAQPGLARNLRPLQGAQPPAPPAPRDDGVPPAKPKAYPDFGESAGGKGPAREIADQMAGLPAEAPRRGGRIAKPQAHSATNYPNMVKGKFIPPHRIVHFDLKGAAPRPEYFREVFALIKSLGATGVLLEWEDMFPFKGRLSKLSQSSAYSEAEIRQILGWAVDAQLDIVPLVQTFGHLEYILKYPEFAKYRQVERYPQVICLGDEEAVDLVKEVVDQVLAIHGEFPMPYFHMGADEAFQIGMCQQDQTLMKEKLGNSREMLMLRHIARIAEYVKSKADTRVLMWHDMLNNVDNDAINEFKLGELAEPVVWAYAEQLQDYLQPDMWSRFASLFPYVWGGSAFKGADGPSRYYSNVPHYLQNHLSWVGQMTTHYKGFREFRGLILTGWQRFDHFAVLCEVLPVGIPSLAVNLAVIGKGIYDRTTLKEASKLLGCSSTLDIDSAGVGAYCNFPGARVYQQVQQLRVALENVKTNLYEDYQVQGWLSRFNIRHNYSQPWYLDQINDKLQMYLSDLQGIERVLREEMGKIFATDTVDEWLYEYLEPDLDRLNEMSRSIARLSATKAFPARPFPIKGSGALWKGGSSPRKPSPLLGGGQRPAL